MISAQRLSVTALTRHDHTPNVITLAVRGRQRSLSVRDGVRLGSREFKAAIDGGAQLVADGKADLAMQLLSEVKSANGVTVVGMLPPDLQNFVVYGSTIPASSDKPEAALAFVKFLSDPNKKDVWKAAGFEMMGTAN